MKTRIFCLEGEMSNRNQSVTVKPLLQLLQSLDTWRCGRSDNAKGNLDFQYCLCQSTKRFRQELQKLDPRTFLKGQASNCLYLAFHGSGQGLYADEECLPFKDVSEELGTKLGNELIYFSNCGGRNTKRELQQVRQQTEARLVIGYSKPVDWLLATMFETWFFSELSSQRNRATSAFVRRIRGQAENEFFQKLGVVVVYYKDPTDGK